MQKKKPYCIKMMYAILSAVAMLLLPVGSYAQPDGITLKVEKVPLGEVLEQIEDNYGYMFLYSDDAVDLKREVSISVKNVSISYILDRILDEKTGYEVNQKQVVIFLKSSGKDQISEDRGASGVSNTFTVSGTVKDAAGEPIVGVFVMEKGTQNGASTDLDGNWSIEVADPDAVLVFSCLGYRETEVPVASQKNIYVNLSDDMEKLEEVVVIGYGTVRKADLAGSVSVMKSTSYEDQPAQSLTDVLQGRVAGITVQGDGISATRVRIRGLGSINKDNSPLYVIDGIFADPATLNIDDVASVQVLKDASATAIYGSQGANGVILITTKTGKPNQTRIMVDAQVGIGSVARRYETLSAYDFATAYNKYIPDTFSSEQLAAFRDGTAGTDWQDAIYHTPVVQDYKVSLSSGNDRTQYYISANYINNEYLVKGRYDERYSARANITSQITDWLHLTAEVDLARQTNNGGSTSIVADAIYCSPVTNIYDAYGNYEKDMYNVLNTRNPVERLEASHNNQTIINTAQARAELKFDIVKGLTFTTTNYFKYGDTKGYSMTPSSMNDQGIASMGNSDSCGLNLQTTNNLTYTGKWGEHSLTATAVYEATSYEVREMSISGNNLQNEDLVGWWNVKMAAERDASNGYGRTSMMSGVGRVSYNYGDRYIFTGTFRADGSSRFSRNKWGYFPSGAFAWSVGNEQFMQNQNIVQDLKLRVSYGLIGNQGIGRYDTLGLMQSIQYTFGTDQYYNGYWPGVNPTPDLKWETTRQFDAGIDVSFWNSRINVTMDYFYKMTHDGLIQMSIPDFYGGGTYWTNAAQVNNRGFEFMVDALLVEKGGFSWNTTITGSTLKNNVVYLADGLEFIDGPKLDTAVFGSESVTRVMPGHPIGAFYGYVWTGLDESGRDTYLDMPDENGETDGIIDSNDRTWIGDPNPDLTLGWNNTFRYRNWTLNLFFSGSFGADKLNAVRYLGSNRTGSHYFFTLKEAWDDNFDNKGQAGRYPGVNSDGNQYYVNSSKYIESADYFRLENLSLSYTLPKKVLKFAEMQLRFSCQNVFTITGYKGVDPAAISSYGNIDLNNGLDLGVFPLNRSYTFGVRLNF